MYGIPGVHQGDEFIEAMGDLMYDPGRRSAPGAAVRRPTTPTSAIQQT